MILEMRFHAMSQAGDGSGSKISEFEDFELPSHVTIRPNLRLTFQLETKSVVLIFAQQANHNDLSVVTAVRYTGWDETVEYPCVEVAGIDRGLIRQKASDVVACLSLLLEKPLSLSGAGQADRIVAENDSDQAKIDELGTDRLYFGIHAGRPTFYTSRGKLTEEHFLDILPRSPGLHLYADALRNTVLTAKFRDYWRVLESAFNAIDEDLIKLLEVYPPCLAIGFDAEELRNLHILRGRASHAKSRTGLTEKAEVDGLCSASLPRLKELAKCVILTKKSWGYPALGVKEAQPFVRVETHTERAKP